MIPFLWAAGLCPEARNGSANFLIECRLSWPRTGLFFLSNFSSSRYPSSDWSQKYLAASLISHSGRFTFLEGKDTLLLGEVHCCGRKIWARIFPKVRLVPSDRGHIWLFLKGILYVGGLPAADGCGIEPVSVSVKVLSEKEVRCWNSQYVNVIPLMGFSEVLYRKGTGGGEYLLVI